jgi:hypothetical protein
MQRLLGATPAPTISTGVDPSLAGGAATTHHRIAFIDLLRQSRRIDILSPRIAFRSFTQAKVQFLLSISHHDFADNNRIDRLEVHATRIECIGGKHPCFRDKQRNHWS